jgi:hypothetical protein
LLAVVLVKKRAATRRRRIQTNADRSRFRLSSGDELWKKELEAM